MLIFWQLASSDNAKDKLGGFGFVYECGREKLNISKEKQKSMKNMHYANSNFFIFFVETEMDRQLIWCRVLWSHNLVFRVNVFDQCRHRKKAAEITKKWSKNSNTARTKERSIIIIRRIAAFQNEYEVVDLNLKMEDRPKMTQKRQHG